MMLIWWSAVGWGKVWLGGVRQSRGLNVGMYSCRFTVYIGKIGVVGDLKS